MKVSGIVGIYFLFGRGMDGEKWNSKEKGDSGNAGDLKIESFQNSLRNCSMPGKRLYDKLSKGKPMLRVVSNFQVIIAVESKPVKSPFSLYFLFTIICWSGNLFCLFS